MKNDALKGLPEPADAQLQLPLQQAEPAPEASPIAPTAPALRDADSTARLNALDVTQSFIVRAPAGSGKTELLTQRVLALLAHAEAPEEVVAITFTRKAAAEMKDRLIAALSRAGQGGGMPEAPHQALTIQLAQQVMLRDRELGWELAVNPARLRVQTIDALALWLAQQLPITTRLGGITQVTEQAEPLYSAAAHATLALIDIDDGQHSGIAQQIERLLTHLDNDWPRVHRLLSGMLARRDQWLRHVGHLDRPALEAPMQLECERQMQRVCEAISGGGANAAVDVHELVELARYAAGNVPPDSRLSACAELQRLPDASFEWLDAWRGLAALLLTNEGNWRSRFSKLEGFPAIAGAASFKQRISVLTDSLRSNDELQQALHGLRDVPAPHFTGAQWTVLEAIVGLFPELLTDLLTAVPP